MQFLMVFFYLVLNRNALCYSKKNRYGTITLIKPSYVNRPVTLKMEPRDEWMGGVVWKYLQPGSAKFRVANSQKDSIQFSENGSYYFTLINAKDVYNNTDFYAECAHNPSLNSQIIKLVLEVPQNSVIVGPQFGDFFKTTCVYADTGIDVFCKTNFGIKPLNVSFKVGGQILPLVVEGKQPDMHKLDHTSFRLKKDMVGSNLTCTALYSANEDPVEFTARLCFVEFGTGPTLKEPSCFYGDRSTATCEVNDALPVPMIEIRLNEKKLKVQQHDEYDRFKNTFSSKTTFITVDKEWNGTEMCCTSKIGNNMNGRSICKPILMSCTQENAEISPFGRFWLTIICGSLAFIGILAIALVCCLRKRRQQNVYQTCAKGITMSSMTEYKTVYSTIDTIDTADKRTGIFSRQTSPCTQSTDYMTPISRTDRSGPIRLTKLRNIDSEHVISKDEQHSYEVPLQDTGNDAEVPMADIGYIDMSG
ncbi:uncharacterized protein LOC128235367 [Mya arenaria]|uniref:uncharacterized protein LOC128235367 n=1 Tax=Mya arenaria TaxID=6604 RepID=UPI0022E24AFC|nr:uncharacterized protein LOC128235367 [Mya arenaria]